MAHTFHELPHFIYYTEISKGMKSVKETVQFRQLFTSITSTSAALQQLEAFWDQVSVKLWGF